MTLLQVGNELKIETIFYLILAVKFFKRECIHLISCSPWDLSLLTIDDKKVLIDDISIICYDLKTAIPQVLLHKLFHYKYVAEFKPRPAELSIIAVLLNLKASDLRSLSVTGRR